MLKAQFQSNGGNILRALLLTTILAPAMVFGQTKQAASTQQDEVTLSPGVSSFTVPSSLREGRDPFYPEATRFLSKPAPSPTPDPIDVPVVLEFKGISGTPERPLAIINNRTFAIGEEQEINTSNGRIKLRLLEIDAKAMRVKVFARGETRELLFGKGI